MMTSARLTESIGLQDPRHRSYTDLTKRLPVTTRLPSGIVFEPRAHRISLGIVFDDARGDSRAAGSRRRHRLTKDACLPRGSVASDAEGSAAPAGQSLGGSMN